MKFMLKYIDSQRFCSEVLFQLTGPTMKVPFIRMKFMLKYTGPPRCCFLLLKRL